MPVVGPYRFSNTDVARTFVNLGMWWEHLTAGISPCPADASGLVLAQEAARASSTAFDPHLPLAEELERLGHALAARFAGHESTPEAVDALSSVWNGIRAAMAALRETHCVPTEGAGHVEQINVSNGGVPKQSIERAAVDYGGIVGDRQGSRQHHGRPWQALSLWSAEVIEAFAAVGNPLVPGAAGENLTLRGLDWACVRPGMLLRIGTALAETTSWAIPCRHNARWFANGDFRQMSHERGPVSRIYATVLQPGSVSAGDEVAVIA